METTFRPDNTQLANADIEILKSNSTGINPAMVTLISEGGVNFYRYLKCFNLTRESEVLVLPENRHYYYDGKELKDVRVIINLRKLNLIKNVDVFLNMLSRILPQGTNFFGCFSNSNESVWNTSLLYRTSKFFGRFQKILDSKTENRMNENDVTVLLGRNGLRTIDMKEMNGLTYFYCKTSGNAYN
jgi:hypothetical protein